MHNWFLLYRTKEVLSLGVLLHEEYPKLNLRKAAQTDLG